MQQQQQQHAVMGRYEAKLRADVERAIRRKGEADMRNKVKSMMERRGGRIEG